MKSTKTDLNEKKFGIKESSREAAIIKISTSGVEKYSTVFLFSDTVPLK
jgi:hypothetical protein